MQVETTSNLLCLNLYKSSLPTMKLYEKLIGKVDYHFNLDANFNLKTLDQKGYLSLVWGISINHDRGWWVWSLDKFYNIVSNIWHCSFSSTPLLPEYIFIITVFSSLLGNCWRGLAVESLLCAVSCFSLIYCSLSFSASFFPIGRAAFTLVVISWSLLCTMAKFASTWALLFS